MASKTERDYTIEKAVFRADAILAAIGRVSEDIETGAVKEHKAIQYTTAQIRMLTESGQNELKKAREVF